MTKKVIPHNPVYQCVLYRTNTCKTRVSATMASQLPDFIDNVSFKMSQNALFATQSRSVLATSTPKA
jgi:hypothetical protein